MQTPLRMRKAHLALAAAGLVLAGSVAVQAGRPLVTLVALTKETVGVTGALLEETEKLQEESAGVLERLAWLPMQERLLAEQVALAADLQAELNRQERLTVEASALMVSILRAERTAAEQTALADAASRRTYAVVVATGHRLSDVAAATSAIKGRSREMEGQLDGLLVEMRENAHTFSGILRWKRAAERYWEIVKGWWPWGDG